MSNKEELLKKIKALADRGVDGERENAQAILYRLMEQYGISEAEIEEDRRETAWFSYSQETERRLLNQIIYMVTGKSAFGCVGTYTNRKRKKMGADCTAAERMEIEANYEFFKAAMEKELEIFYAAFANKMVCVIFTVRRSRLTKAARKHTERPCAWRRPLARKCP